MGDTKIYNADGTQVVALISDATSIVLVNSDEFAIVGNENNESFSFSEISLKENITEREKIIHQWMENYILIQQYRKKLGKIIDWVRNERYIAIHPCNLAIINDLIAKKCILLGHNSINNIEFLTDDGKVYKKIALDYSSAKTSNGREMIDAFTDYMNLYPSLAPKKLYQSLWQEITALDYDPKKIQIDGSTFLENGSLVIRSNKQSLTIRVKNYAKAEIQYEKGDGTVTQLLDTLQITNTLRQFIQSPKKCIATLYGKPFF